MINSNGYDVIKIRRDLHQIPELSKKEYKKLIYVSETDNSKLMKYENYSTKYELINSFVSPIVLGAIIIFLLRIFYKKVYKVD